MAKWTEDEVVEAARWASRCARRIGHHFKLDEERLESAGFSSEQIDRIYARVETGAQPVTAEQITKRVLAFEQEVEMKHEIVTLNDMLHFILEQLARLELQRERFL